MIMDTELLPVVEKASQGDPEAIMKLADAYLFGEGVPQDLDKADQYYMQLASFQQSLPFVEYEYLNIILGDIAARKGRFDEAIDYYKTSYRLFQEVHGLNAMERMDEVDFTKKYQDLLFQQSLLV